MNLNEVKKHVIVQVLCYILIGLTFIVSLIAILITPTHASELKTSNITGTIKNTSACGTQEWNHYCYGQGYTQPIWSKSQFGASEGYGVEFLAFDLSGITAYSSSPSTIEIYNAYNSFANKQYRCSFGGTNEPANCSVSRVNNGRINVNFTTSVGGNPQYLYIDIGNGQGGWDGIDGININKVMLLQTIDDPNANIISNANQNTNDVINNNNENTQNILNSLNQLFQNMCPNILNMKNNYRIFRGIEFYPNVDNNNIVTSYDVSGTLGGYNAYSNIYDGSFSSGEVMQIFTTNCGNANVQAQAYYGLTDTVIGYASNGSPYTFTSDYNQAHIDIFTDTSVPNGCKVSISLSHQRLSNYCVYGSSLGNKLDGIEGAIQGGLQENKEELEDIKDIQQDQYNYLTDDSDPTIDNNEISSTLGLVNTSNPLAYLLTLPLNLLNKINVSLNSSCSDYTIGAFGDIGNANLSSYTFKFSCIEPSRYLGSSLWAVIDVIMGISLLVITIKWFYNSISNFLTLGAEEEAKAHLGFMSPMEWLSTIIGSGSIASGFDGGRL